MKVIKPNKLALLPRPFEDGSDCYLAVGAIVMFSFDGRIGSEQELWPFTAAQLGTDGILDVGMPKPHGEVVVTGIAYPPGRRPQPVCAARVQLGPIDKTLYVIGDREWRRGVATEPVPYSEMPIAFSRAFGGEGVAHNPVGKGFAPVGKSHPLPNVESPNALVMSPHDRPEPAGFGALDITWPQRASKLGTYDAKWLRERAPGFAEDMDLAYFHTAPEDQRLRGFFRGDEAFVLENLHPDRPRIEAALPSLAARAFINQKTSHGELLREVAMHLETVHLFPHAERGVLVFRGLIDIGEDDAHDVIQLLAGLEAAGEPKPEEHYREVLRKRLDPKKGHLHSLRDSDLLPATAEGTRRQKSDIEQLIESDNLLQKNMQTGARKRAEEHRQAAIAQIHASGLDPALFKDIIDPPPEEPDVSVPDLEDLAPFIEQLEARAEQERAEAEQKRVEMEKQARDAFAEAGMDYDAAVADAEKQAGGPPKFTAKAERERLTELADFCQNAGAPNAEIEAMLASPVFDRRLRQMEALARDGYRRGAHLQPPATAPLGDDAQRLRNQVVEAYQSGRDLADQDWTGVNLAGLELSGADFRRSLLECASFAGASLRGARFDGAVLARADLSGANLTDATFEDANLGLADLSRADLTGADLNSAVLWRANLAGAILRQCDLTLADLSEATLKESDFGGAVAQLLTFMRTDLSGARFAGADLSRCTFLECSFDAADFSGAQLVGATFVTARGQGALFCGANAANLRLVKGCVFDGADFRGATLEGANLRATSLVSADFSDAKMNGADLSECNLRGARLALVQLREARLVRANLTDADLSLADLMGAVLQKAEVAGASFRQANLFRADMAKVAGDDRTRLQEANVAQARFIRRRRGQG